MNYCANCGMTCLPDCVKYLLLLVQDDFSGKMVLSNMKEPVVTLVFERGVMYCETCSTLEHRGYHFSCFTGNAISLNGNQLPFKGGTINHDSSF